MVQVLLLDEQMKELARRLMNDGSLLLFGRGYNYATALEAALKVKEVALMHRHVSQASIELWDISQPTMASHQPLLLVLLLVPMHLFQCIHMRSLLSCRDVIASCAKCWQPPGK